MTEGNRCYSYRGQMYKRLLPLYRRLQDVDIDSTQPCTRVIYFPIFVSVIAIWCWLRK